VTKALWRFHWDCRRAGHVRGLFVATDEEIKAGIGKAVYFGEILGKHSEVQGTLEEKDLERLTDDADFIAKFEQYDCASGYNPLKYFQDEEEEMDE
jgi:hypothetical protein